MSVQALRPAIRFRKLEAGAKPPATSPNGRPMSTSVSSSPADSAAAARKNRTVRRWVVLCSGLLLAIVLFLIVRTQGFVSGYEFSPTHFQQRRFSFYEIPLLHLQITPIRRSSDTPPAANYVRQNSLITAPKGVPQVWHLVSISRGVTGSTPADAALLIDQLKMSTGGKDFWRQWSLDHPQHAKVLWPLVQNLAERELYILLPRLFEIAQLDQPVPRLQQRIDDYLKREYAGLIQDMRAADRVELADQLLQEAINDYPDDQTLQSL